MRVQIQKSFVPFAEALQLLKLLRSRWFENYNASDILFSSY